MTMRYPKQYINSEYQLEGMKGAVGCILTNKIPGLKHLRLDQFYELLRVSEVKYRYPIYSLTELAKLEKLFRFLQKLWDVADKYGYTLQVVSGFRPEYINNAIGGTPDSQHLYYEAVDVRVFKDLRENTTITKGNTRSGNFERLYGDDVKKFYEILDNEVGDEVRQMFWYSWGIHASMPSQDPDRFVSFSRGKK
jgi:hypothetical protein